MASYAFDEASKNDHIRSRSGGKPFERSLRLADDREAIRVCGVIDEAIKDLQRERLEMPIGLPHEW